MAETGGAGWARAGGWLRRPAALIAAGTLVAGFGGGYLTARTVGTHAAAAAGGGEQAAAWPFFGKPRAAGAKRTAPPKPEGFAVWRQRIDTSRPDPLACIEMTRPLDPATPYGDFVLVSPAEERKPAVTVSGAELCIGGLGLQDRKVTLLKGLPAAGGEVLAANAEVDVAFGEKPPYVGFAGDGVILPREDADGVGVETINVSKLAIEVWRVPDRNLVRREIGVSQPAADDEYMYDEFDDPHGEGRRIWKGEVAVRGPAGQRVTTVFPLGAVIREMAPGGYVILARDASGEGPKVKDSGREYDGERRARARRWVIFTDMALATYSGSDGLDVVVRSLKTAKTLSGVKVTLVSSNGEDLAQAVADAAGRAHFAKPLLAGEGTDRPRMVMAYGPQSDLAVLDLDRSPVDLSKQGVGGRTDAASPIEGRAGAEALDSYVYADRGIYRPGETVHLVAMLRDRAAAAVKQRKGALVIQRPSGVEFQRVAFDQAQAGVVAKDVMIPKDAPRGRWTAKVEVDGSDQPAGAMSFQVEDFAPQRLAVDADAQAERPVTTGERRPIAVQARFLYGAPGAGLQTQIETRIAADPNPFPKFEGYRFGDDKEPFQEVAADPISTVTDGSGRATLNLAADVAGDPSTPLKATVTTAVFEPGGRPVRESLFLKLRPRPLYLGIKVDEGQATRGAAPVSFDLIAVNAAGQRVAASGVSWALYAERWDYDWYQQDGRWRWRRTYRDTLVERGSGAISPAASLRYTRKLEWGDYRLEATGPDGARAVVKFAAGWGAPGSAAEAPDLVRVSAGTRAYAQGDTVEVSIKGPYAGQALVAVATDQVIDFKSVDVPEGGARLRLKTSAAWGGGAYVLVTLIQPRDPAETPKPRRAIGLVYVPLEPKGRKLAVEIGAPAKLDAREKIKVPIKVGGLGLGQRAHVTLSAVDEGILRLTKFASPDPAKWYFGKRALSVDYRDDYGRLLDPNLGAPAALNYGADSIGGEGLTVTPIKTVALWSGVVTTGVDGRATVELPAAAFNGELRLMAVAWTDTAVGSGAKAMTVREPVVAELNLPRFLAPGDTALATLELHNLEGKAGSYDAQVQTSGGVLAPFKKLIALLLGQRTADHVQVHAPAIAGVSRVDLKVAGPSFATVRDYQIQTRVGWGAETRTFTEVQQPGQAFTPSPELMRGLAAGTVTMQVSYSPFRGFDPGAVAVALSAYPYGCTEQTVSAAYPMLYAAKVGADPKARRSTQALNQAVGRLIDRQSLDGAFGLWSVGDGQADPWVGAYTVDFLLEAKAQGAPVSDEALRRALDAMWAVSRPEGWVSVNYQMSYPGWWMSSEDASRKATERMRSRASAYALYVLAKGGRGDLSRLRWWHDVQMKSEMSPTARAQVGAALAMMGDRARARSALRAAAATLGYRDESDHYASPLRDLAAVIAYAYEAGEPGLARALQPRLEGAVKDPDLLNTQEQARLLQAAYRMLQASGPVKIEASGPVTAQPLAGLQRWTVGRVDQARFVNRGQGPIFRTVTLRGQPTAAPAAASAGMTLSKVYWTMNGGRADLAAIAQGERIIVQVSGGSNQGRSMLAVIDDALPAGFEIEAVLSPDDSRNGPYRFLGDLAAPSVQEARDDRYVAAVNLGGGRGFSLAYVARAVTPGSFFLPGAETRDMYRPGTFARTAPGRVTIAAR